MSIHVEKKYSRFKKIVYIIDTSKDFSSEQLHEISIYHRCSQISNTTVQPQVDVSSELRVVDGGRTGRGAWTDPGRFGRVQTRLLVVGAPTTYTLTHSKK